MVNWRQSNGMKSLRRITLVSGTFVTVRPPHMDQAKSNGPQFLDTRFGGYLPLQGRNKEQKSYEQDTTQSRPAVQGQGGP